jgi:hypothetical protein
MKIKYNIIFIAIVMALFVKCTPSNKKDTNTAVTEVTDLKSDSIFVNEIIDIHDWISVDNQIIIQTSVVDTLFYSYLLPDFQFYYMFGTRGQGPAEYIYPKLTTDGKKKLYLYDNAKKKFVEFALSEKEFVVVNARDVSTHMLVDKMLTVNDTLFCIKESNSDEIKIALFSIENNEFEKISEYKVESDLKGKASENDFLITNNKEKMATFYIHKKQIRLYQLSEKKEIEETFTLLVTRKENKNVFYYSDLCCTDKYIFALYQGFDPDLLKSSDQSTIEVYNWDGKLIKTLKADRIINRIIVNENINCIYGISPYKSEYIYKYETNI